MSDPKYYLKVNLPPNFNDLDAEVIKKELMTYMNSRNQWGALYGPKSSKKGITIEKVIYYIKTIVDSECLRHSESSDKNSKSFYLLKIKPIA